MRAFFSYSHLEQNHWAAPGTDDRTHMDFKLVADISAGNTIRFSAIWNDALNDFYANPALNVIQQGTILPFNTPGSRPSYQGAVGTSTYYQYRVNPFKNLILSAPSNFQVADNLKFDTIPYYWYGFGNGGGVAAINPATTYNLDGTVKSGGFFWGNLKISNIAAGTFYNPSITETNRPGVINKFTYKYGEHTVVAGNWFEYARHQQTGTFSPLNADGTVADYFGQTNTFTLPPTALCQTKNSAGVFNVTAACPTSSVMKRSVITTTMTNALFVGDTWNFAKGWSLDAGVKEVFVNRGVEDNMPGAPRQTNTLDDTQTLPTAGIKYKWDDYNQVFASVGTTFRSPANFNLSPNYSSSGAGGATIPGINIPPTEKGVMYEIGHRFQGTQFATSVSGFLGRYQNFQQSSNILDPNTGTSISTTLNAGGLEVYGVDAEIGTRPIYNFRPYIAGELLHTELLDNIPTVNSTGKVDYLATKGKQLVGAPNYSFGIGLDYDDGHFFANTAYKYLGAQYSTFINDERINGYGRLDASVGYRFKDFDRLKQPEVRIQFFNVLNDRQLVGVNSFQNNAKAQNGVNGGTINGSTPNYYQGQDFSFLITLRAGL